MAVIVKGKNSLECILQAHGVTKKEFDRLIQLKMSNSFIEDFRQQNVTLDEAISGFLETKKDMSILTQEGYAQDLKQFKTFIIQRWEEKGLQNAMFTTLQKGTLTFFLIRWFHDEKKGTVK